MEIQKGALKNTYRVLLLDDLLATGGSIKAAIDLVQQSNALVTQIIVIIELKDLNGRALLPKNVNFHTLLSY